MREVLKKEGKIKEKILKADKECWVGSPYCTGANIKPITDSGYGGNVIIFKDEFHCENITRLIKTIETVKQNEYTDLTIYFDSEGGVVSDMLTLADYINSLEDINIHIISNGYLCSAGFYIFFLLDFLKPNLTCNIHDLCQCVTHKSTCREDVREMSKELVPDFTNETYYTRKKVTDTWLNKHIISKLNLTEEQLKWHEDGYEIYMTGEDMKKLMKNFFDNKVKEMEKEHILEIIKEAKELEKDLEGDEINEIKC